jgi:hypothetical protein
MPMDLGLRWVGESTTPKYQEHEKQNYKHTNKGDVIMKKLISIAMLAAVLSIFAVVPANATWVADPAYNTNKTIQSIRINGTTSNAIVQIWCVGESSYIGFNLSNGSASAMLAAALSAKATGSTINVHIPSLTGMVAGTTSVIAIDFIDINQ